MADYSTVQSMKAALDGYSEEEQKLKELYANARNRLAQSYDDAIARASADRAEKRSAAAADVMRSERNADAALAARGLSFSGEAAQSKLNSALLLNERFKAIDKESADTVAGLGEKKADELFKNELEEAEKTAKLAERRDSLYADIAKAESAVPAKSGTNAAASENAKDGSYTPSVAAKTLAEKLIAASGAKNGVITDQAQSAKIKKALSSLTSERNINESYLDDLYFALTAAGYDPDDTAKTADESGEVDENAVKGLTKSASAYFTQQFEKLCKSLAEIGLDGAAIFPRALSEARKAEIGFIRRNCENEAEFRAVCANIGVSDSEIADYLSGGQSRYRVVRRATEKTD